jgi:hypothetical protein
MNLIFFLDELGKRRKRRRWWREDGGRRRPFLPVWAFGNYWAATFSVGLVEARISVDLVTVSIRGARLVMRCRSQSLKIRS